MTQNQRDSDNQDTREPVFLSPPAANRPPEAKRTWPMLLFLPGLALLLGLAVALLLYRPVVTVPPVVTPETATVPTPVKKKQTTPADEDPNKGSAEADLGEWLRIKAKAEGEEITIWAPEQYQALLDATARADTMFKQKLFERAQAMYAQNSQSLAKLLSSKSEILAQALEQGETALEQLDAEAAARAFGIALAIDPAHAAATMGLQRAGNLNQVIALHHQGLAMEKEQKDLSGAAELLRQAVDLDPAFTPAVEDLARIRREIDQHRFQKAMGRLMVALTEQDPQAAQAALIEAGKLKPGDPAVSEAGQEVARLIKEIRLAELRNQAKQAGRREQWADALRLYDTALKLDPQAAFAAGGRDEAARRLKLDHSIQEILAAPQRLQEDGPLANARRVLARAQVVTAPGPVLQGQIRELDQLISRAATVVEITLRSDNMTTVEIYHVGRFQPFTEHRLRLRPGTYTVIGKRPGFRDVRKKLIITPEQADKSITFLIRCEEPI